MHQKLSCHRQTRHNGKPGSTQSETLVALIRGCKSFARKCEKTVHPVTTAVHRSALCLKSPFRSVNFNPSLLQNYRTVSIKTYHTSNSTYFLFRIVGVINENAFCLLRKRLICEERVIIQCFTHYHYQYNLTLKKMVTELGVLKVDAV